MKRFKSLKWAFYLTGLTTRTQPTGFNGIKIWASARCVPYWCCDLIIEFLVGIRNSTASYALVPKGIANCRGYLIVGFLKNFNFIFICNREHLRGEISSFVHGCVVNPYICVRKGSQFYHFATIVGPVLPLHTRRCNRANTSEYLTTKVVVSNFFFSSGDLLQTHMLAHVAVFFSCSIHSSNHSMLFRHCPSLLGHLLSIFPTVNTWIRSILI